MYHKILVPLDGSLIAEQAIPQALALAQVFDSELYLVQVITNYLMPPYGIDYQMGETFRDVAMREAHEYLETVRAKLEPQYGGTIQTKVIEGLVAENIIDFADFQNIDIIVMATHGRSGVGRWVFGSIAERVLRASHCPILLVRATDKPTEDVLAFEHKAESTSK